MPDRPDRPAASGGHGPAERGPLSSRQLEKYREKRDPARTPEPFGGERSEAAEGLRFVVQEHHATALHWDFRLERDGVLVSWAVPKGIPPDPRDNRMAVHTEDHPLDYIDFAGEIPKGEYGGGQVYLWDQGTYECEKYSDREVIVVLHGRRTHGRYALIKTKGKNWLMHRMDPPDDPGREPFPSDLRPMRPKPARRLPAQSSKGKGDYVYAPAWGGLHVLLASEGGRVELTDEDGTSVTERFPDFRALGRSLGALGIVLDGEVVTHSGAPAVFFANDLVWLDGHTAASLPFADRRRLLDRLDFEGGNWRVNPTSEDGKALRQAAFEQGLFGVLAFATGGRYEPGQSAESVLLIPAR